MLSTDVSDRLEALAPEPAAELRRSSALAQAATDPALLALCRDYIDAALHCRDWQPPEGGLTDRERAFIDFTEQFVTSVSSMDSAQVDRLREFASADEVYAFTHALYVTDMSLRLDMVGRAVLP